MFEIPAAFAHGLGAGERGRAWLASLPALVDELLQRWHCDPAGPARHGRVGIALPVRCRDHPPAVIKVSFPDYGSPHEPAALAAWNGAGAVRLYEHADSSFAMLLEQARSRTLAGIADPEEALTIQGRLAHRLAVPAPAGLPRLSDSAGAWEQEITSAMAELADPLPKTVVAAATATLRELGAAPVETLLHGDLHDTNILAADRESWLAIDPKVHVGDPAYDAVYVLLSPRFGPLLTTTHPGPTLLRYLDIYCEAAEIDRDRARRWTQAGAVREALQARRNGEPAWLIEAFDRAAEVLT
ncbi:aminoglycoside phosphotransferase family protein [Nocardia carnea]|uniref:aminoglycoside phosphotransferase family protein n=1 Tax=Nocardia carnea TaxID=37328 RepID=UPI002456134A|nr:aminoglycoside phosphotransferase family protein [Nocardia carnea]